MNTWTDSGLAAAGRMGAMLALGVDDPAASELARRWNDSPAEARYQGERHSKGERHTTVGGQGRRSSVPHQPGGRRGNGGGGDIARFPSSPYPAVPYSGAEHPGRAPVPSYPMSPSDLAGRTDGFLAGSVSAMSDAPAWEARTTIGALIGPASSSLDRTRLEPTQLEPTQLEPVRPERPEPTQLEPARPELPAFEPRSAPPSEPGSAPATGHAGTAVDGAVSFTLGSLDSSDLFNSLSRRNR